MKKTVLALHLLSSSVFSYILLTVMIVFMNVLLITASQELSRNIPNISALKTAAERDWYFIAKVSDLSDKTLTLHDLIISFSELRNIPGVEAVYDNKVGSTSLFSVFASVQAKREELIVGKDVKTTVKAEDMQINIMVTTGDFARTMKLRLSSGRQPCVGMNENGNYEALVTADLAPYLKVGNIYTFYDYNNVYKDTVYVEIVGVIREDESYIAPTGTINFRFLRREERGYKPLILINFTNTLIGDRTAFFKLSPELSEDERATALYTVITQLGCDVQSCRASYDSYVKDINKRLNSKLPQLILFSVLTVLTTFGCTALNTLSSIHKFSLYYLTGATVGGCAGIIARTNLIVFLVSAVITVPALKIYIGAGSAAVKALAYFNFDIMLPVSAVNIISFLLSLTVPLIIFINKPITLYNS